MYFGIRYKYLKKSDKTLLLAKSPLLQNCNRGDLYILGVLTHLPFWDIFFIYCN